MKIERAQMFAYCPVRRERVAQGRYNAIVIEARVEAIRYELVIQRKRGMFTLT